ncbi:MAG: hypothetical protein ACKODT_07110 [Fluviibacter sp.]
MFVYDEIDDWNRQCAYLLAVEYEEIMKNYNPFEGMDGYAIMP